MNGLEEYIGQHRKQRHDFVNEYNKKSDLVNTIFVELQATKQKFVCIYIL